MAQSTFVVNSTGDGADFSVGDGICSTSAPNGANECTLRAAIEEGNNTLFVLDTVYFDIPLSDGGCSGDVCTITPASSLPTLESKAWLDARSQSGTDCSTLDLKIVLDGVSAGSGHGLWLGNFYDSGLVAGFVIHRFPGNGIYADQADINHIMCNIVGTDVTGTTAMGNGERGIYSYFGYDNVIGTNGDGVDDASERNLVSGNGTWGIHTYASDGDIIAGNLIGSNLAVTDTVGNMDGGVLVWCSEDIVIGSNLDAVGDVNESNVIVGNGGNGIELYCGGARDLNYEINLNYIGTNQSETIPLGNRDHGIRIPQKHNLNSGTTKQNVIANNSGHGFAFLSPPTVHMKNHRITENTMYANGGAGIKLPLDIYDLPNDPGDADAGSNNYQNFPEITVARQVGVNDDIELRYYVDSDTTNSKYPITVEFFHTGLVSEDEGRYYYGNDTYSYSDYAGCGAPPCVTSVVLDIPTSPGMRWVATATDANGNTSEFSPRSTLVEDVVSIGATAFLEGPYAGSAMNTALQVAGYLPLTQPFMDASYNATVLNFDSTQTIPDLESAVDWVLASLRTGTGSGTEVSGSLHAAIVHSDGRITSPGEDSLRFVGVANGSYYLVIRSRNHADVMSSGPIDATDGNGGWDFTTASAQAYGTNPMKDLGSSIWGLFASDGNVDGDITAPDFNLWNAATSAGATGYEPSDYNLDGDVTAPDFNLWNANTSAGAASQVP